MSQTLMAQTQRFTFGAIGGVPGQTPLGQTGSKMPFAIGPVLDVRLSSRFSLESGILFHRMGQSSTTGVYLYPANSVTLTYGSQRGHAIELPFLAKYHFLGERHTWRPFITAGPTVRRTSLNRDYIASVLSDIPSGTFSVQPGFNTSDVSWHLDPTAGVGADVRTGRFHLEPQVRYSYWGAGVNSPIRKNQFDFLLGFRF